MNNQDGPLKIYQSQGEQREIDPITGLERKGLKPQTDQFGSPSQPRSGIYFPEFESQETTTPYTPERAKERDFAITPDMTDADIADLRGHLQPVTDIIGNAVGNLVAKTVGNTFQGLGYMQGLAGIDNHVDEQAGWIAGAADNYMAKWGQDIEKWATEEMPIYQTREYMDKNPFSKMLNYRFWATDFVDVTAFMAGMYLPGGVAAKLGFGAKLAGMIGKTAQAGDEVAGSLARMAAAANVMETSAISSASMAMYNAKTVRDDILEYEKQGRLNGTLNPNIDYKDIAAKEAAKSFRYNLALNAVGHYITAGMLLGGIKKAAGKPLNWLIEGEKVVAPAKIGWEKYMGTSIGKTLYTSLKGGVVMGPLQMGIMNEIDTRMMQQGKDILQGKVSRSRGEETDVPQILSRAFTYDTEEKSMATLSGMLFGSIFGIKHGMDAVKKDKLREDGLLKEVNREYQNFRNISDNFQKEINGKTVLSTKDGKFYVRKDVVTADGNGFLQGKDSEVSAEEYSKIAKENNIPNEGGSKEHWQTVIGEDGIPVLDKKKYDSFLEYWQGIDEMNDVLAVHEADGDVTKSNLIRKANLAKWATAWFKTGQSKEFYDYLDSYAKMSPRELQALGIDPAIHTPDEIKSKVSEYKDFVKRTENHYNAVNENIVPVGKNESSTFRKRKELLHLVSRNIFAIADAIKGERAKKTELEKLPSDGIDRSEGLKLDAEHKILLEERNNLLLKANTDADYQRLDYLDTEISSIKEQIKKYNDGHTDIGEHIPLEPKTPDHTIPQANPLLAIQEIKIRELEKKHEELNTMWTGLFNNNTWNRTYNKLADNIAKENVPYPYLENIPLKGRSLSDYDKFEGRKLKKDRLFDKILAAKKQFFNESINEMLREYGLKNTIEFLIKDNTFKIDGENYDRLAKLAIEESIKTDEYETAHNNIVQQAEINQTDLTPAEQRQVDELLKKNEQGKKDQPIYDKFLSQRDNLVDDNIKSAKEATEGELKRNIASNFMAETGNILKNLLTNSEYSDVTAVENQIGQLQELHRIISSKEKEGKFDPEFSKEKNSLLREFPEIFDIANSKMTFLNDIQAQISKLNEILNTVKTNQESKAIKDRVFFENKIKDDLSNIGIDLMESSSRKDIVLIPERKSVYDSIKTLIGDYFNQFEEELKKQVSETELNYNTIKATYDKIIENISEKKVEEQKQLSTVIAEQKKSIVDKIDSNPLLEKITSNYKDYYLNPKRFFQEYVLWLTRRLSLDKTNDGSSLNLYLVNGNMYELKNKLESEKSLRPAEEYNNLKEFIDMHVALSRLYDLEHLMTSKYDYLNQARNEKNSIEAELKKDDALPTPNVQQLTVIRQVIQFLFKPFNKENSSKNIITLQGEAGTGKTTIMQWIARWSGIGKDNIFATAPKGAADIIADKMSSSVKRINEDLIPRDKDGNINFFNGHGKKYSVIIIDEFNSISTKEAAEILKAYDDYVKQNPEQDLKLILSGDPNQSTPTELLNLNSPEQPGINSKDFYATDNLNVVYRTMVGPITDVADIFKISRKDLTKTPLKLKSNEKEPWNSKKELFGVGGITGDFISHLRKIIDLRKGDGRTRAIIVHKSEVDQYKKAFPDIEVFPHDETHGMERDEVYVNINPSKYSQDKTKLFNKDMYTAITRAKKYVALGNVPFEFIPEGKENEIQLRSLEMQSEVSDISKEFLQNREEEIEQLKKFSDEDPIVEKKKDESPDNLETELKMESEPEIIEEVTKQEGDEIDEEYIPNEVFDEEEGLVDNSAEEIEQTVLGRIKNAVVAGIHQIVRTTSHAFKGDEKVSPIKAKDNVFYVKEKWQDPSDNKNKIRIRILSEADHSDKSRKVYREIGILTREDLRHFSPDSEIYKEGNRILSIYEKGDNYDQSELNAAADLKFDGIHGGSMLYLLDGTTMEQRNLVLGAKVSKEYTNKLAFRYKGEGGVTTKNKVLDKFFKDNKLDIENEQEVREGAHFKIFSQQEIKERNAKFESSGYPLYPYVPYLVIDNARQRGRKSGTSPNPFYIRLSPRKINHTKDKNFLSPLIQLDEKGKLVPIKLIDDTYGGKKIAPNSHGFINIMAKLNEYFDGLELNAGETSRKFEWGNGLFNKLIREIADMTSNEVSLEKRIESIDKHFEFLKEHEFKDVDADFIQQVKDKILGNIDEIHLLSVEADKLVYSRHKSGKHAGKRNASSSIKAQSVFNILAQGNLMPNDVAIRTMIKEKTGNVSIKGRSLLGGDASGKWTDISTDIHERLKKRYRKAGKTPEEVQQLVDGRAIEMKQKGITVSDAMKIFQFDEQGNAISDGGFGLRTSLNRSKFNSASDLTDGMSLNDNFSEVIPTAIGVEYSKTAYENRVEIIKPAETTSTTKDGKVIRYDEDGYIIPDGIEKDLKREGRDLSELGKEQTFEETFNKLKKWIPDITREQVQAIERLKDVQNRVDPTIWGRMLDGILYLWRDKENLTREKIARHEGFHYLWNYYFTAAERAQIEKITRLEYPEVRNVEEHLALKWMDEAQGKYVVRGGLYRFVRKIGELMGLVSRNVETLPQLFKMIDRGYYTKRLTYDTGISRDMAMDVKKDYFTPTIYNEARKLFTDTFVSYLRGKNKIVVDGERASNLYYMPHEAYKITRNAIISEMNKLRALDGTLSDADKLRLTAIERLMEKNKEGIENMYQMFNHQFPDVKKIDYDRLTDIESIDKEAEVAETGDDTLRTQIAETGTLNEESRSHLLVKSFIATIKNKTSGEYINASKVYKKLIDTLSSIDFRKNVFGGINNPQQLEKKFGITKGKVLTNTNDRAIYDELSELFTAAYRKDINGIAIPTNMSFFTSGMFLAHPDKSFSIKEMKETDRSNLSVIENFNSNKFYQEIRQNRYLQEFFKENKIVGSEAQFNFIKEWHGQSHAIDILAELTSNVGSLYESNPHVGYYKYKFGENSGLDFRYVKNAKLGVYNAALLDIKNKIRNAFSPLAGAPIKKLISPGTWGIINQIDLKKITKDDKSANAVINTFIHELGFDKKGIEYYTSENPVETIRNLKELRKDLETIGEEKTVKTFVESTTEEVDGAQIKKDVYTEEKVIITSDMVMGNQSSRINDLAEIITEQSRNARATSYLDGKKKPKYYFQQMSNGIETLFRLKGNTSEPPEHLSVAKNNDFFTYNWFFKGSKSPKQIIYQIINHDSVKYEDTLGKPKMYQDESRENWLRRNMIFQMESYANKGQELRYIQSLWTISDRTWTMGAEIDMVGRTKIREGIIDILKQEASRVDPKDNPAFDVNNYNEIQKGHTKKNWERSFFENIDLSEKKKYDRLTKEQIANKDILDAHVNELMEHLNQRSERLIDFMLENYKDTRPSKNLKSLYSKMQAKDLGFGDAEQVQLLGGDAYQTKKINATEFTKHQNELRVFYRPLARAFYMNNFVNGYFLNQAIIGDFAFMKDEYDITKRSAVVFAPGYKGLIGKDFLNPKYKAMVVADIANTLTQKEFGDISKYFSEPYEITNGQGFMLPEASAKRARFYGKKLDIGLTQKPVYSGIDENGITRQVKYSSIELTDKLVEMFPPMKQWRDEMRKNGTDELLFPSGFKVGAPTKERLSTLDENFNLTFNPNSVVDMSMDNWRVQFNPEQSVNKEVKVYHQIIQNLNNNGLNSVEYKSITSKLGKLISNSISEYANKIRSKNFTSISDKTIEKIREDVMQNMAENERTATEWDYLNAKDKDGNYIFPIDHPIFAEQMSIQISSMFSRNTVEGIKFKGAHLVLQSAVGTYGKALSGVDKAKLKYRNEKGHMEVYLPDMMQNQGLKQGDLLFGFRIPASGFHMGAALEVKGFYPSYERGNIIILPEEVTLFKDSDYDIDELHVVRHAVIQKELRDPLGVLKMVKGTYEAKKEGKVLSDWVTDEIDIYKHNGDEASLQYIKDLKEVEKVALTNEVLSETINTYQAKKNDAMALTTMSFDRFEDKQDGIFKWIEEITKRKIKPNRLLADPVDQMNMFYDNKVAKRLKSTYNIYQKGMTNIFQSIEKGKPLVIREGAIEKEVTGVDEKGKKIYSDVVVRRKNGFEIWDDKMETSVHYDRFHEGEMVNDGTSKLIPNEITISGRTYNPKFYETGELYIVSAIDAVKKQILNVINNTESTASAYVGMTFTGVPLDIAIKFMKQPALTRFTEKGFSGLGDVWKELAIQYAKTGTVLSKDGLTSMAKNVKITEAKLTALFDKKITELTADEVLLQVKVIEQYNKMNTIGKDILNIGSILGVNKNQPVFIAEMEKKINKVGQVYKDGMLVGDKYVPGWNDVVKNPSLLDDPNLRLQTQNEFSFPELDILNNPFHRQSLKALLLNFNTLTSTIRKSNKLMIEASNDLYKTFEKGSFSGLKLGNDKWESKEKIRTELFKYLMSDLSFDFNGKEYSISTKGEEPFKYLSKYDEESYVGGSDAWSQRFIQRIDMYKELMNEGKIPPNPFLNMLEIRGNETSLRRLTFSGIRGSDLGQQLEWRNGFDALNIAPDAEGNWGPTMNKFSEIQMDLLKYSILNNGLSFSNNNYNMLMSPELFEGFNKAFEKKIDSFLVPGTAFQQNIRNVSEHFLASLVLNKADRLQNTFSGSEGADNIKLNFEKSEKGTSHGVDAVEIKTSKTVDGLPTLEIEKHNVVYDVKIKKGEGKMAFEYPQWLQGMKRKGMTDINVRVALDAPNFVYYQLWGHKGINESYQASKDILDNGYHIENVVDPYHKTVAVDNVEKGSMSVPKYSLDNAENKYTFEVGEIVNIRGKSDSARIDMRQVEITKVSERERTGYKGRKEIMRDYDYREVSKIDPSRAITTNEKLKTKKDKNHFEEKIEDQVNKNNIEKTC